MKHVIAIPLSIGEKLASEIPVPVHNPCFYLKPTDKSFHVKIPSINVILSTVENDIV